LPLFEPAEGDRAAITEDWQESRRVDHKVKITALLDSQLELALIKMIGKL
jgi:hypothetical protein